VPCAPNPGLTPLPDPPPQGGRERRERDPRPLGSGAIEKHLPRMPDRAVRRARPAGSLPPCGEGLGEGGATRTEPGAYLPPSLTLPRSEHPQGGRERREHRPRPPWPSGKPEASRLSSHRECRISKPAPVMAFHQITKAALPSPWERGSRLSGVAHAQGIAADALTPVRTCRSRRCRPATDRCWRGR